VTDAPIPGVTPRRRRLVALGFVAVLGAVAVVTFAAARDGADHLARARHELADDRAFVGPRTAGAALVTASIELQRAGDDCEEDRDEGCDRLYTAAAFARVSAVDVLDCRRPDLFTFRSRFRAYVDDLADGASPVPPTPPRCD
jgi:hypothetical protein